MTKKEKIRSVQIRLPLAVFKTLKELGNEKPHLSMNAFIIELLQSAITESKNHFVDSNDPLESNDE